VKSVSLPRNRPETWIAGVAPRTRPDQSASGAVCGQACHAATTAAASTQAKEAEKLVTSWVAKVAKVICVTMPKLPPPPPRRAQNRSA